MRLKKSKLVLIFLFCIIVIIKRIYSNEYRLDDVSYDVINVYKNEKNKIKFRGDIDYVHLYVKNSSWEEYKITSNFLNKYKPEYGVCPELNIIDMKFIKLGAYFIKHKVLIDLTLKDGLHKYAISRYKFINEEYLDDIETYIIPDDKMNLSYEEMYKLAFND